VTALLVGLLAAGCTSTVVPPSTVEQPAVVFLLREAMHVGVVLPVGDVAGADPDQAIGWVEYGFGEWAWFAEQRDDWYRVFPAMLWPTAAAMSRRDWGPATADQVEALATARGCRAAPLVVEAAAATALRERLDTAFDAERDRMVAQPAWNMTFVPADTLDVGGYWLFRTCADVSADWFSELGCTVTWAPVRTSLELAAREARERSESPRP
jgi:hypothetical protein